MADATRTTTIDGNAVSRAWQRTSKIDPRYLIAFLITLVLVAAQLRYHMLGSYDRLVLALVVCTGTEALLSWFDRGKFVNLLSAYISGISLTLLIKPQGGALWPFALRVPGDLVQVCPQVPRQPPLEPDQLRHQRAAPRRA